MKKTVIILVILAIVGIAYYIYKKKNETLPEPKKEDKDEVQSMDEVIEQIPTKGIGATGVDAGKGKKQSNNTTLVVAGQGKRTS
jgi:hypothetical protein